MSEKLRSVDLNSLLWLAEFRALLVKHLAVLAESKTRSVRRRMDRMVEMGLVEKSLRKYLGANGRPEIVYSLSPKGISFLKSEDKIKLSVSIKDRSLKTHGLEHLLSLNWALISVTLIPRFSSLDVRCFSYISLLRYKEFYGIPFLKDSLQSQNKKDDLFYPDGIFVVHHDLENKSLLFFLELDRSTEPLVSKNRKKQTLSKKFQKYERYLSSNGYKKYEDVFESHLNGFRLLVVCDSEKRLFQLSELARQTVQSDFIWLTMESMILNHGIASSIWIRGGHVKNPRYSILGKDLSFEMSFSGMIKQLDSSKRNLEKNVRNFPTECPKVCV